MTLSADEKNLLRQAIIDGAFSGIQLGQQGAMRAALTPQTLETVASMDDEAIRTTLRAYLPQKVAQVAQSVANTVAQANSMVLNQENLQASLISLQAIIIGN